jgi:hypothetical protein
MAQEFTPFPVPVDPADTPLVVPAGPDYRCSGCGGTVPAGVRLYETIEDGMVVGLLAMGPGDANAPTLSQGVAYTSAHVLDGEVVHACGKNRET